jgi:ubiquinone/menaquinone biosynthesis C-methylase UbiE
VTGQPGPHSTGPVAAAFDRAASAYDSSGTEPFRELGWRLVQHAGITAGERVADLGCGAGAALIPAAIAARPGGQVTGVDASQAMLDRARQAASDHGLDVMLQAGDVQDPPLPPGSADVVIASSVLPLLDWPLRALRAWRKLLAPGGRLAVSWGMRQDPAWFPVMAALDDAVPRTSAPGFEEFIRRPPFTSPADLERALVQAGYAGAVTSTELVVSVYQDPGQWWDACQSQAPWAVSWQHIPAGALGAARDTALSLAEGLRGSDGLIRRTLAFGCTVARRPA